MGRGRHSPWSSICFHCRPGFNCSCKLKKIWASGANCLFLKLSFWWEKSYTVVLLKLRTYLSSTFWSDSSGCSFVLLALRLPPFSPCRWNYLSLFHQHGFNEEKRIFGRANAHSFARCFDQLIWTKSPSSSFQAYLAWGEFPVITTVSTTALPIEELPWPSFTICNQV